jgi:hypothetical protein
VANTNLWPMYWSNAIIMFFTVIQCKTYLDFTVTHFKIKLNSFQPFFYYVKTWCLIFCHTNLESSSPKLIDFHRNLRLKINIKLLINFFSNFQILSRIFHALTFWEIKNYWAEVLPLPTWFLRMCCRIYSLFSSGYRVDCYHEFALLYFL